MDQKIVWGYVNADRTVQNGSGFKVASKVSTGVYTIIFDNGAFSSAPAVTVTVKLIPESGFARVAYLQILEKDQFQIHIRSSSSGSGGSEDQAFTFIAVGNPGSSIVSE